MNRCDLTDLPVDGCAHCRGIHRSTSMQQEQERAEPMMSETPSDRLGACADEYRVAFTPGSIAGVVTARKRHRCDGHLRRERHYIEPGEQYVANALPPDHPDIGNLGWWHARFCAACAPLKYAELLIEEAADVA